MGEAPLDVVGIGNAIVDVISHAEEKISSISSSRKAR